MFRSVRSKVIATATGIAISAVIVSSSLAAWTTGSAFRDEAERSLEVDTAIYRSLLDHAQDHDDWSQIDGLVASLSKSNGRRIALVAQNGGVIVDSDRLAGLRPRALPRVPTAQIDPRAPLPGVSSNLSRVALDPVALARLNALAGDAAECLGSNDLDFVRFENAATGPQLLPDGPFVSAEQAGRFRSCVASLELASRTDGAVETGIQPGATATNSTTGAPAVSLFLGSRAENPLQLTGAGLWRIIGLVVGVALAAAGLAWLLGRRITRPLVALTAAARQLGDGRLDTRVPVEGEDEVGELALAFNSMADSLARTEQSRRRMTADIAHELRNPLVTINGTLEAIQDGVYEPTPEVIESMIEETDLLRRIITDLQDLAAIDAGTLRIVRHPVDLVELCDSMVDAHRATAPHVSVSLVSVAGPVLALVDADRVRQIVGNLLSNALRHTPAGGQVAVSIVADDLGVSVVVADTGTGIDEMDLPHVFERLWRADASRARDTGGSGLGLSIARGLARAQGGEISVQSTVGEGTTFTVRLAAPEPTSITGRR